MRKGIATRQPLLWAALAYAAGIVAGVHSYSPPLWWAVAAGVFLFAATWFHAVRRWRGAFGLLLATVTLAALGAWGVHARDAAARLTVLSQYTDGEEVAVTAHVVRDGLLRGRGRWQRQSVDLETETVNAAPVETGMRLTIYSRGESADEEGPQLSLPGGEDATRNGKRVFTCGERLRFTAKLREPRNFGNPGAWDYVGYLHKQGIVATGSADSEKIEVLPGLAGSKFGLWRSRARRSVLARIHQLWPGEQAGLFDAMLIGERSFIARETAEAWQRTGIYHILVVSGMNVGILAAVVFGVLRRVRAGELLATVLTLLLAAGYAYLAESGAPILRAVLMLAIFLGTRLLYRDRALLNALGAAALALLVADPRALFDPSFQLTFLSVLAIAGIAVPLLDRTSEPSRRALQYLFSSAYDLSLPPRAVQFRLDLRLIAGRLAQLSPWKVQVLTRAIGRGFCAIMRLAMTIFDIIVVSGVAQLAMTLPMAFYFHRATVVGLPANTLAVPLTGVLMSSSALALALSYVSLPFAKLPAVIASWSLAGITGTVHWLGAARIADWRLATPAPPPSLAAAGGFAVALLLARRRWYISALGLAALIGAASWLTAVPPRPALHSGALEMTAIDVGQAESFLLATPDGHTLLVDAAGSLGPWQSDFDFGEDVIAPYLWSRGITRLDAVALSHAHSDHMGGMASVITIFRPRELWIGPNAPTPALDRLLRHAEASGLRIVRHYAGDRFPLGNAGVEVLAPSRDWQLTDKPRNDDSLVLRIWFGETAVLLTGDIDRKIERVLLDVHPRAQLLKVAHNGSTTSTTPEFLAAVRPRFAVISVGAHNSFGHPRREVLERLAAQHVLTYRTDLMGASTFLLDGKEVTARTAVGSW